MGIIGLDEEMEQTNPFYKTLPDREKLNLHLIKLKFPAVGEDRKRVLVVSRSLERSVKCKPPHRMVGCIKPLDKLWLDWLDRPALVEEKLQLQGFALGEYNRKCVPSTTLGSLAGNAIPVPLCSAINLSLMVEFSGAL